MINAKMEMLGSKRSVIRELFEYGMKRKAEIGEDNVFDFSLGNPSVEPPASVNETLIELIRTTNPTKLHAYTSAPGDLGTRRAISDYLNENYGTEITPDFIYMTVGAAGALTSALTAIAGEGEEVIILAPFFPEYRVFIERTGASVRIVPCDSVTFQPDIPAIADAINEKTAAIIVNSPNNPSGAVFTEEKITELAELLSRKSRELSRPIYLISDEPYRELVYGDAKVPYLTNYYDNTIVCYSFSKSLSLPGERIGYVLVSPRCDDAKSVYAAVAGAARALGFVCAPALLQYLVARCLGQTADISVYDKNRTLLCSALTEYGYTVVKPDGAFYLFVKALEDDAVKFAERAKAHELLLVPSDDFGIPGYVRISYCTSTEQITRALPAFRALANDYLEG